MKRNMNLKVVAVVIGLAALIVSFQNCSRVDFVSTEALSSKGAANGDTDQVTILLPDDQQEEQQQEEQQQGEEEQLVTQLPQEPQTETPDTNEPKDEEEETLVPPMVSLPSPTPVPNMITVPDDTEEEVVTNPTPAPSPTPSEEARRFFVECESKNKKAGITVAPGGSVENLSGSKKFNATSLNNVRHLSGNQDFLQSGATMGSINLVENVSGTTWICGFDVKSIKNISGNLIVVGGNIDSIDSKSGTVKLVGGTVGTITNSSGNFKFEEIH